MPDGVDADSVLKSQRDHHRGVARDVREICAALASVDEDLAERAVGKKSGRNCDRLVAKDEIERLRAPALWK